MSLHFRSPSQMKIHSPSSDKVLSPTSSPTISRPPQVVGGGLRCLCTPSHEPSPAPLSLVNCLCSPNRVPTRFFHQPALQPSPAPLWWSSTAFDACVHPFTNIDSLDVCVRPFTTADDKYVCLPSHDLRRVVVFFTRTPIGASRRSDVLRPSGGANLASNLSWC